MLIRTEGIFEVHQTAFHSSQKTVLSNQSSVLSPNSEPNSPENMQNGSRYNFDNSMNFHPPHQQIDRFPSQNPPIYSSSNYAFQPRHSSQFHQPTNPPIDPQPLPSGYGGCSDYEQRLKDEVIHLHSLWRRGPPQIQSNNTQYGYDARFRDPSVGGLTDSSIAPQIQNPHLKPNKTTTPFKKNKKKKKKPKKTQTVSDNEWPVDPKPACPSPKNQGWGEFKTRALPVSQPATAQEQERVFAVRVQLKGLDSCIGFFHKSDDDDGDGDGDDEEDEYDDEEVFEFMFKVFEEDEKLREYYKTKFENGEFYCLVCGVIANKLGRKYKDCIALVQHSATIAKTKKKIAHRAYGRVVCKVLGWDIDQLPSLVSTLASGNAVVETQFPQGQVKNGDDGSFGSEDKPPGVEREGDPANTRGSQVELGSFRDVVEKDYVNTTDDDTANQKRDAGDDLPS